MMRAKDMSLEVYLCNVPTDMRKSIDGLAALVQGVLYKNPFDGKLFVFTNKRRDKIKILYWERSGFVVWFTRLEKERFYWPNVRHPEGVTLTVEQLNWLLDGYNINAMKPHARLMYSEVA